MKRSQRFAREVTIRFAASFFLQVRALALIPLLARALGADGYGAWSQISISLRLIVPVLMLRFEMSTVRYLAGRDSKDIGPDFFALFFMTLGVLASIAVAGHVFREQVAYALFGADGYAVALDYFLVLLFAQTTFRYLSNYNRVARRIARYSVIELSVTLLSLGGAFAGIALGQGLIGVLLAYSTAAGLGCAVVLVLIWQDGALRSPAFTRRIFTHLKYSMPLVPNRLLNWVIGWSDRFLITHLLDLAQTGIYAASYGLGQILGFFNQPISFVLFPMISELWKDGEFDAVRRYIEAAIRYYLVFALPFAVGVAYLAREILTLLAGSGFFSGTLLVVLIILGLLFVGLHQIYVYIVHLHERTRYLPGIYIVAAGVNVGLNVLLIPSMGILGAAVATASSFFIQLVAVSVFALRLFPVKLDRSFLARAGGSVGGMLGVMHAVNLLPLKGAALTIAVTALAGGLTYFGLMWLSGGIRKQDLSLALSALGIRRRGSNE